ncbi:MAG: hypothetical protein FWG85_06675 [Bacteroidetes bacterium]|nr:hypothetical protein [Bacteroidota bacterium]
MKDSKLKMVAMLIIVAFAFCGCGESAVDNKITKEPTHPVIYPYSLKNDLKIRSYCKKTTQVEGTILFLLADPLPSFNNLSELENYIREYVEAEIPSFLSCGYSINYANFSDYLADHNVIAYYTYTVLTGGIDTQFGEYITLKGELEF